VLTVCDEKARAVNGAYIVLISVWCVELPFRISSRL
jgi:hypothetical protein